MTADLARRVVEIALGAELSGFAPLASGRSCQAFLVRAAGGECVIGPRLPGSPIDYGTTWTTAFADGLGRLLAYLHALPCNGFGPLVDVSSELRGECPSALPGVVHRWCWAHCWPFDGAALSAHPIVRLMPELVPAVAALTDRLLQAAGEGPFGVVHSDLHREHLLAGPDGDLTGVLDFGDAFVGAIAWDLARLHWYYGTEVAQAVARRQPNGAQVADQARLLVVAIGLYKLAKNPNDSKIPDRLARVLRPWLTAGG